MAKYSYCFQPYYVAHMFFTGPSCITTGTEKTEIRMGKHLLHVFDTPHPDFLVEPLDDFVGSQDFMSFRLIKSGEAEGTEICHFRADNIVDMRRFMACLGGCGKGIFSPGIGHPVAPIGFNVTGSDVGAAKKAEIGFSVRGNDINGDAAAKKADLLGSSISVYSLPARADLESYSDALSRLPLGFYYNILSGFSLPSEVARRHQFPGTIVPPYDASFPTPSMPRRRTKDTFRPPLGEPVEYLYSLGYEKEVNCPEGMQEIYNPCTGSSFFLDHSRQVLIFPPPPPPPPPPVLRRQTSQPTVLKIRDQYRDPKSIMRIMPLELVAEASERARRKPARYILQSRGSNGENGKNGREGAYGRNGANGQDGIYGRQDRVDLDGGDGKDGDTGGKGWDGGRGANGNNGGDVNITLTSYSSRRIDMSGVINKAIIFDDLEDSGVLLVDCRGGDGGQGGNGGRGGKGGSGGKGGLGNYNGSQNVLTGKLGRPGDGGDGGRGGRGGCGGNGGDGGAGGGCVVQTTQPELLMLVEVDCVGGKPSIGGKGGDGGEGGGPGRGGSQMSIQPRNGRTGKFTGDGVRGDDGVKGSPGADGWMWWVVLSPRDRKKVEHSHTRYEPKVVNFEVSSSNGGGVYEPNSKVIVSGVAVFNAGGLTLPRGTKAFIPSTSTIKFDGTVYMFPGGVLKPQESYVIPCDFHGRLRDLPPPISPGPQSAKVEFETRIELLGRAFPQCSVKHELTIQYPVQLGCLLSPENLARGEIYPIGIEIRNISSLPYGSSSSICGNIVLQLHLDPRLVPLGPPTTRSSYPYVVTYDPSIPDSLYIEVLVVPPNETVNVQVMVQMEEQAELFELCPWQVDLFFREKLIEYNHQKIRVSPSYFPDKAPADVLFVTNEAVSRKEFVLWNRIFGMLDISVDTWDVAHNHGFSVDSTTGNHHTNSWRGRYTGKMILFPHCDLDQISLDDMVQHFSNEKLESLGLESSLILLLPKTMTRQEYSDAIKKKLIEGSRKIDVPEGAYGGRHSSKPVVDSSDQSSANIKWEGKYLKDLEQGDPSRLHVVFARKLDIRSVGFFQYSYGSVDIRQYPIPRSSKFLGVGGAGHAITDMGADDANLTLLSNDIPLASNFGQIFLVTLFGLPSSSKLKLLRNSSIDYNPISFYLPNKLRMSCEEIVVVALAWDVAEELYSGSGQSFRMRQIHDHIRASPTAFRDNGRLILRGLNLAQEEAKACTAELNHPNVSRAYDEIVGLSEDVDAALSEIGIDNRNLEKLVGLKVLWDEKSIHRSHMFN